MSDSVSPLHTDCGTGCSTIQTTGAPWRSADDSTNLVVNQKCVMNLGNSAISARDFHASLIYSVPVTNVMVITDTFFSVFFCNIFFVIYSFTA